MKLPLDVKMSTISPRRVASVRGRLSPSPQLGDVGAVDKTDQTGMDMFRAMSAFDYMLSLAGVGVGAYHGYRRNNSVGWAIGWALLGGVFPVVTIAIALAQGLGKRATK